MSRLEVDTASEFPQGETLSIGNGSERFAWKSMLLTLGLSVTAAGVGVLTLEPFAVPLSDLALGLRAIGTGAMAAAGWGLGFLLTSGLNVLREDVISLSGHGELHPKSPSLQSGR